ncbi:kinase-like domain-containing protein [Rhizophagus clarus]|uniref:Kinase-like domain-containing protein n=1 Tax=Rhizophagus clarus TaxID=94130 RepID=A0A8H3QSE0_9GLOM|nr:kinase-like domain-containing protein [Rhizophagus clarus]
MATIREDLIFATIQKAFALNNYNKNLDKQYKFMRQTILKDKSLTKDEKLVAIKKLSKNHDIDKIRHNEGKRRICNDCEEECLATLYCEYCVRNYLKQKFSYWTSGNNDVNDLIQKCQMESLAPNKIVEWIPYKNIQNIKYLTRGGFSEIYTAEWIGGQYYEWDSIKQQLKRYGTRNVILKRLENVESANRSWFEEAKSHLIINNKWSEIVPCYGLTQDPSDGSYMLVMRELDTNLREYLRQNKNKLTWKEKIKITVDIIDALNRIHKENVIHRDLHSGNILYLKYTNYWFISDLGFCGPANKPLKSIYGNLPYIAPEIIIGKEYTKASDVYSIAMLMWEISSGQPPFANYEDEYDLAIDIVNGVRPKIVPGTPPKYKELIERCWDADPTKRYDINTLLNTIDCINKSYYQNTPDGHKNMVSKFLKKFKKINNKLDNSHNSKIISYYSSSSKLLTSRVYQFIDLPGSGITEGTIHWDILNFFRTSIKI